MTDAIICLSDGKYMIKLFIDILVFRFLTTQTKIEAVVFNYALNGNVCQRIGERCGVYRHFLVDETDAINNLSSYLPIRINNAAQYVATSEQLFVK